MDSLISEQLEWSRRRKQDLSPKKLRELILKQDGLCALSKAPMFFLKKLGTPVRGCGCHPLYAAIDHIDPQDRAKGCQLVCYDLNDLKSHLPPVLFDALSDSMPWKKLMALWREQAERDPQDKEVFKDLIRTGGA